MQKGNIQVSVFGLTERFDKSLLLMQKILGWKNVYCMRRNVRKRRALKDQLPVATLRLIEEYEEKDLELCKYADRRLTEMLDTHCIDDEQVRQFRTMNRRFGFPLWACKTLKRKLVTKVSTIFGIPE